MEVTLGIHALRITQAKTNVYRRKSDNLGLMSFLRSCSRLVKLAKKPGIRELWFSVKICFLGIIVIGVVGFIVKLLSGVLQGFM